MRHSGKESASDARIRWTTRLRLEPVEARHARDIWRIHQDARISEWHAGKWSVSEAERSAAGNAWESDGVSKWIAYSRITGDLVGRGGCSRAVVGGERCVEIGWAIRDDFLEQGYATEIGLEGLAFAFDVLDSPEVLALTEVHNVASRAVMERIGMSHHKDIAARGLIEGRDGVHPNALFAVYRITRPQWITRNPRRRL